MVQIVELSEKELSERQDYDHILDTTRKFFQQNYQDAYRIDSTSISIGIFPKDGLEGRLIVTPGTRRIDINSPNELDIAVQLATAYEGSISGSEFKVKKNYVEPDLKEQD